MKKIFPFIFCCIAVISSCTAPNIREYKALDNAIARQDIYDAGHDAMQQKLREVFRHAQTDSARWVAAYELKKIFYYHDIDSCLYYCRQMMRCKKVSPGQRATAEACYAHSIYMSDSLVAAARILDGVDTTLLDYNGINEYCGAAHRIYREMSEWEKLNTIIDMWWRNDSTDISACFNYNSRFSSQRQLDESVAKLQACIPKSPNDTAKLYYYLAREYHHAGDLENAALYYAKGAAQDLRLSCKTYNSLYELSKILFSQGDIQRADRYMRIALKDAGASHYSSRYKDLIESEFIVMNALLLKERQKRTANFTAALATALLLLVAVVLLLFIARQAKRLTKSEKALREVSKIKDSFLARYMETSVDYLNKVDEYRSSLRSTVKNEGIDAVKALLRKPSFASEEFEYLLRSFDSTFLGIFPDFVEKVNANMQEQYRLEQPAPGELSTELRILALIKMGISKRQKIAKVLNMSVTTVYSYHSNLQKHSLHPGSNFDKIIALL